MEEPQHEIVEETINVNETKEERKKVAVLAIQHMIKQKSEVEQIPEYVEAPEISRPEDQVASGSSQKQIEERMKNMAAKAAAGFNTTAMGVGMRDLGFAISKSRGEMDKKEGGGGKINVKAIAKQAETVVNRKKYTLLDLQTKALPGVPKDAKEHHLNDEEFVVAFGMEREDFEKLAPWKQKNLKQTAKLF